MDIEDLVSDETSEFDVLNERWDTDGIVKRTWHQEEVHEITQRVGERQDFGRPTTDGSAYGLALGPPFAPWPCRWTFTTVASTMAYSMSGSSDTASKSLRKTPAFTQSL